MQSLFRPGRGQAIHAVADNQGRGKGVTNIQNSGSAETLKARLPDVVSLGDEIPERHHRDWSSPAPVTPAALIRPRTTAEVSAALALCSELRLPVVPQGGLTGLAGGALPLAGGAVLSLERMRAIGPVDVALGTMTAESGAILSDVQKAAAEAGMYLGLDLGARDSCTIGGCLSTNAGGIRVIRYGMARAQVLGLEAVLADGTVISSMNRLVKNNTGYDLKQLFIGSEGTLGVITRAVLRLYPDPGPTYPVFCGCSGFDGLLQLYRTARMRLGASLSAFEAMWPSFHDTMIDRLPGLPRVLRDRHPLYAVLEASGPEAEMAPRMETLLAEAMEEGWITDAALPASPRARQDFWAVRECVSQYGRALGQVVAFDIGVPLPEAGAFVAEIETSLGRAFPGVLVMSYGHVGDSNLHVVVHSPAHGDHQPSKAVAKIVYETVAAHDGTVSAEHGIGLLKKPYLAFSRNADERALMVRLKRALDPLNILNPGKLLDMD